MNNKEKICIYCEIENFIMHKCFFCGRCFCSDCLCSLDTFVCLDLSTLNKDGSPIKSDIYKTLCHQCKRWKSRFNNTIIYKGEKKWMNTK